MYAFENRDGDLLNVQVDIPGDPAATVVIHHGYAGSISSPVVKRLSDVFNRHGFVTVRPDTRNSLNSSGGRIDDFTFSGHASDLADVADWATAQPWFAGSLHLAGYSLGGYSAASLAAHRKDVESLLLVAPVLSGGFFAEAFEVSNPGIMRVWKSRGALPFTNDAGASFDAPFAAWSEWIDADALADFSFAKPITVISAGDDTLILPSHLTAMAESFGRSASFTGIEGEDHFFAHKGKSLENSVREHILKIL